MDNTITLSSTIISTPLGDMLALADATALYLLEFVCHSTLEHKMKTLQKNLSATIVDQRTPLLSLLETELHQYFAGELTKFTTPLCLVGTPFQQDTWNALQKIPHGHTRSYKDMAHAIGRPSACRAVAQANRTNHLVIVVPCHRVINSNGSLGGYNCGIDRKEYLLKLESAHSC